VRNEEVRKILDSEIKQTCDTTGGYPAFVDREADDLHERLRNGAATFSSSASATRTEVIPTSGAGLDGSGPRIFPT
jgi:hypothetical protein